MQYKFDILLPQFTSIGKEIAMKKLLGIAVAVCALGAVAADSGTLREVEVRAHNDSQNAHSYITVVPDTTTGNNAFGNATPGHAVNGVVGNASSVIYDTVIFDVWDADTGYWYGDDRPRGTVGYFTYDPATDERVDYGLIPEYAKSFTVNDVTATTQIGFYTAEGGEAKATDQSALILPSALNDQEAKGPYIADFDTLRSVDGANSFTPGADTSRDGKSDVGILLSDEGYVLADNGFISTWTSPAGTTGGFGKDWMGFRPRVPAGAPLPGVFAVLFLGGIGAGAMKLRKCRK